MTKIKKSPKRPRKTTTGDERKLEEGRSPREIESGSYQAVQSEEDPTAHDLQVIAPSGLDEDLYGFAATALMRDSHFLAEPDTKGNQKFIRYLRLSISLVLIIGNTLLQVYLIYNVKKYITSETVSNVRGVYDKFEEGMYDEESKTVNGNSRGIPGHFHPHTFGDLSETEKEEVCQIPLSQPHFLLVFIFLWSLTCLSDVKTGLSLAYKFFVTIPTVPSMKDAMKRVPEDVTQREVVGITWFIRFVVLFIAIIPRMGVGLTMTWLGCRWLIATNSFADLFLNAVALAFVFDLKDTFYNQLLPDRNKRDVQNTLFPPAQVKEESSVSAYVKGLLIAPVTVAWAIYYVYQMQAVLPDYGWDVHGVCKTWLIKHYTV